MILHDATRLLSEDTLIYPGDPEIEFRVQRQGTSQLTRLHISTHTGTHIDAPLHFLQNGKSVDELPLAPLMGPCRVLNLQNAGDEIRPEDLKGRLTGERRVLLQTSFSWEDRFRNDYPHLTPEAAAYLKKEGIICVGIDSPSVEEYDGDGEVHRILLSGAESVLIIELLDLSEVTEGDYRMVALPLRLEGLDGSPARVVLCSESGRDL
jgi:arylformamidase